MTAQDYITEALTELARPIPVVDLGSSSLDEAIFARIMSKKFRKLKADQTAIDITKEAIRLSVCENKPIAINVIFGGNKLWHFEEAPEIDWAELFTAMYLARWMKSIASVYPPGAYLEFYSEEIVLEAMNNLPPAEADRYTQTFKDMLDWLKVYLPANVSFGYKRYRDEYEDVDGFSKELEIAKAKVLDELGGKLPDLTAQQIEKVEMNVRLRPGQTEDPLWREKVELIHKSIERTPTMERYINDPAWVPACPTNFPGCITTGSTKRSMAKFWVAVGALISDGDAYSEIVLTPRQLETAQYDWQDVRLPGLVGKNFSQIRVL